MRARFFWRLGLAYLVLLVVVLFAVDLYSARVVRSHAIRSANDQLVSLLNLAAAHPPDLSSETDLRAWTDWMAKTGARVTLVDAAGRVLTDSSSVADATENPASWPEVQEAFANGTGHSVDGARESVARAQRFSGLHATADQGMVGRSLQTLHQDRH